MNEEHRIDQLAAYALGSLDEAESCEVARHLVECDECRAELHAYQAVVDRLPLAARHRTPPPHLRQAILDRVTPRAAPAPVSRPAARPVEPPLPWWRRVFSGRVWVPAMLVLIALLVLGNILLFARLQRSGGFGSQAVTAQISMIEMKSTGWAPSADGVLVYQPAKDNTLLIVEGMPILPQDQQYQLWLIQGNHRDNGGTFTVRPNGYGVLVVNTPKPLTQYDSFGVTVEPAGGSSGPTGEKVLGGKL